MKYNWDSWNNPIEIKLYAMSIRKKLDSTDANDVQNAMKEYVELVDSFFLFNERLMTKQQYKAAIKDFDYFMQLVEITLQYSIQMTKR